MEPDKHILGCLLGTAIGDAIGLPREGLSRRRAVRIFGVPPLHHRFLIRKGMCSDDTEHTVMVAQSYLSASGNVEKFGRDLARRMRWWFLRIPAGIGRATLRACLKLWLGFGYKRSGVKSAGNGPAMRSAILGVLGITDNELKGFVEASTRITHTDARAIEGAIIIAKAASWAADDEKPDAALSSIREMILPLAIDQELLSNMTQVFDAIVEQLPPNQFADLLGLSKGVSGYINHTVPMAMYCWLIHREQEADAFRDTVESAVELGGDSDTVAAIAGALVGAEQGADSIPCEWLEGLAEWPMTKPWLHQLACDLTLCCRGQPAANSPEFCVIKLIIRNIFFTAIVLLHGFRRLLPPY